ncbi:MAG: ATP-binding protein [Actinobacteria bacterium]|nr:ATP-binding protein [Actinomycetota bacterium]
MSVPSWSTRLSDLRAALDQWLVRGALGEDARAAIVLATHEALANAFDHSKARDAVLVRGRISAGVVLIEVQDTGEWLPAVFEDDQRGRGLVLITGLTHALEIDTGDPGTTLRMAFRLSEAALAGDR